MHPIVKKAWLFLWLFITLWIVLRFLLPPALPFLAGLLIALAAEPAVRVLQRMPGLRRGGAAGIAVTAVLLLLGALAAMVLALPVRQLSAVADALPDMERAAGDGLRELREFLLRLAGSLPASIAPLLLRCIDDFFSGSTELIRRAAGWALESAANFAGHLPGSVLGAVTAVLSAYLISARLPAIRSRLEELVSREQLRKLAGAFSKLRSTLMHWLLAQLKLSAISLALLLGGFLLLRIPHALIRALLTALVDVLPVLGTGTVLLPWSAVYLLRGEHVRAAGMLGLYVAAAGTRSALEPRLVGAQLGLDPLAALIAMYTGFRLWGLGGMILLPLAAVSAARLLPPEGGNERP